MRKRTKWSEFYRPVIFFRKWKFVLLRPAERFWGRIRSENRANVWSDCKNSSCFALPRLKIGRKIGEIRSFHILKDRSKFDRSIWSELEPHSLQWHSLQRPEEMLFQMKFYVLRLRPTLWHSFFYNCKQVKVIKAPSFHIILLLTLKAYTFQCQIVQEFSSGGRKWEHT